MQGSPVVSVKRSQEPPSGRAASAPATGRAASLPTAPSPGKPPAASARLPVSRSRPAGIDAKLRSKEQLRDSNSIMVQPGDSLWKLSRRYFGKGRLWRLLWKANAGIRDPHLIRPGQLLLLPPRPDMQFASMARGGASS
jgi:nucleoid-associated protein YgaU